MSFYFRPLIDWTYWPYQIYWSNSPKTCWEEWKMWLWWTSPKPLTKSCTPGYCINHTVWNRPRDICMVQVLSPWQNPACDSWERGSGGGRNHFRGTTEPSPRAYLPDWHKWHGRIHQALLGQAVWWWHNHISHPHCGKWLRQKCQEDLQALERLEADWLMKFHPDICSIITITRKKTINRYPYISMAKSPWKKETQNITGLQQQKTWHGTPRLNKL